MIIEPVDQGEVMPLPVRALPVIQNWDCHGCTTYCREYVVHVTDAEMSRIEEQGWSKRPEFAGVPLFKREGRWRPRWSLNHKDGGCVFLGEGGRCRIHEQFGSAAKPLACRIYPFVLVPAGDHWQFGLRFACPSVARGEGRPVNQHLAEIREYAAILEQQNPAAESVPAPPLQGGQRVPWGDIGIFVQGLAMLLDNRNERVELRLRKCLALANLCRQARFDKVSGERLEEFLGIMLNALGDEVPRTPSTVPPPTWVGRILFRQLLALYARKDTGPNAGLARRGRLALLGAAVRFARGSGPVPRVHALLPETTFEKMEEGSRRWPTECEEILERYYLTKLHSLQFAGPTNFRMNFWEGLESLVLTFPAIAWLSRAFADRTPVEAVQQALQIVDDSFGYHPLLGSARQKLAIRILSFRGEIARLVAWYSR
jgi:lysine-N-methylase